MIAERRAILEELGLNTQPLVEIAPTRKRVRSAGAAAPAALPQRRSTRVCGTATVPAILAPAEQRATDDATESAAPRAAAPAPAGSARSMPARVDYMNSTYMGQHVPCILGGGENQAKRAVSELAGHCGARPSLRESYRRRLAVYEAAALRGSAPPTFSIMSGMQVRASMDA